LQGDALGGYTQRGGFVRYFVTVAGQELEVDLVARPAGGFEARVGGKPVEVDAVRFGAREMSVRVGPRVVDLTVEGTPPELGVVASGRRTYVHVESERSRMASRATRAGGGGKVRELRSPMPGRVVKYLVAEGDAVVAGQAVVIVEAMKMENEVKAKGEGTVSRVHVAAGATVESNAVLLSFA